ncbi:MAG: ATP-grasp fold amidoligase family protein [Solibacillus sp.]
MKKYLKYGFHQLVKRSPITASHLLYMWTFHRRLRLHNPQTINEKLMWLKLYEHQPLKSKCADKLAVRNYVRECGYQHLLIELLDVYDTAEEINFATLPDRFVLKCTHGSGFNLFCLDQTTFSHDEARAKLASWQQQQYGLQLAELHYCAIRPRIVAEKLLEYNGDEPLDYHIHCFHGKPRLIEVQLGEDYLLFDVDWNLLPFNKASMQFCGVLAKPGKFADMLEAAEALSAPFTYVRVDIYNARDRIYFSELTFTPAACLDTDFINDAEYRVGEMLDLTNVAGEHLGTASYELAIKQK